MADADFGTNGTDRGKFHTIANALVVVFTFVAFLGMIMSHLWGWSPVPVLWVHVLPILHGSPPATPNFLHSPKTCS